MEKEYVVITKEGIDVEKVDVQLREPGGNALIPHRECTCANPQKHNDRITHWMLTDEEAENLRQDIRILEVDIPVEEKEDVAFGYNARAESLTFDKTFTASNVNWGLSRCTSATNNFGDGVDTVTEDYLYALDGEGVDVVIMDSGIESNHPEWEDANGNSRLKQIDWYAESNGAISGTQGANFYTDTDGHGTFCAGIVAGKTYGWAKGADIYSMKIFDSSAIGVAEGLDLIRHWHNNKGTGRQTIVNMSYGYYNSIDVGAQAGDTGRFWNGTSWVDWTYGTGNYNSASNIAYRTNISQYSSTSLRVTSIDTRIDQMIAAGIHVVVAGGNNFDVQFLDTATADDNYNDYFQRGGGTYYYHRGSSPRTSNNGNEIVVGNIASALREAKEQPRNSSARGPAIDIWAPGTYITSATSTNNTNNVFADYPSDSNFKIANNTGTSFAAPQVCGLGAMYLQLYPTLTPAQLKEKMIYDSKKDLFFDRTESEYNEETKYSYVYEGGFFDAPKRMLYNRFSGDMMVKWS